MNRIYFALGLLVVMGLCWLRYDHVVEDRDAEKLRADNAVAQVKAMGKELVAERENAANAESRASKRQTEKEELKREYDQKVKCIDDGTCGVVVRWKRAICAEPSLHSADSGSIGLDEGTVAEQKDFGRWLASLEASIDDNYRQIKGLQNELAIKSAPDYCRK